MTGLPTWLIGALAVGAFFLLASRGGRGGGAPRVSAASPVALVGDSIMQGLIGPLGRLLRERGVAVLPQSMGILGSNARQWVRLVDPVLQAGARTVILNVGGNDAASSVLTAEFARNIQTIVGKIRAVGAVPILLEPPSRPSPSFQVIQQGLRQSGAIVFVPSLDIPRAADGIHFTADGYRQWAQAINAMLS